MILLWKDYGSWVLYIVMGFENNKLWFYVYKYVCIDDICEMK